MKLRGIEAALMYLMYRHNVTREVAQIAMNHNRYCVRYADDALYNDISRSQYEREARECGLDES